MKTLFEKYRPSSLDEVLGQDKAIKKTRLLLSRGWGSRAWWISGASGTGKTTIARIIATQGADKHYVQEFDSADQLTAPEIDRIEQDMHYFAPGKGGRAYIINEAHGLRKAIIRRLLGLLERIPDHVCIIFTTTKQGESSLFDDQIDAHPLLSRCAKIELTNQGLAALLDYIESNGIKLVLVERADRLARDLMVGEVILSQFRDLDVSVIATDSGVDLTTGDDDPTRTLIRQVLGAVSQFEKSIIVLKLRAARERTKRRTGRCEGRKPYGYYPGEDRAIERIKEPYRKPHGEKRMSYRAIARQLNKEGFPTRTGAPWSGIMVKAILTRKK